ncbi:MAG: CRTAC1 family protein [Myxococcales bacterium]|nr:CRTAC1 family protein [Myxococcales bacterium]MCB9520571.1 CRTAC1 family protein [Myxococcales bacterium]MCB9531494.1 CRTAC1 family protein [Myxococcales bacterium]
MLRAASILSALFAASVVGACGADSGGPGGLTDARGDDAVEARIDLGSPDGADADDGTDLADLGPPDAEPVEDGEPGGDRDVGGDEPADGGTDAERDSVEEEPDGNGSGAWDLERDAVLEVVDFAGDAGDSSIESDVAWDDAADATADTAPTDTRDADAGADDGGADDGGADDGGADDGGADDGGADAGGADDGGDAGVADAPVDADDGLTADERDTASDDSDALADAVSDVVFDVPGVERPEIPAAAMCADGVCYWSRGISASPTPCGVPTLALEDVTLCAGVPSVAVADVPLPNVPGLAWSDMDRDGWVDYLILSDGGRNEAMRNRGDGTFERFGWGDLALEFEGSQMAAFADFDNDGFQDVFIAQRGINRLFWNDRGRGFVDVTERAGVGDRRFGVAATWGDYDRDGDLDLYVGNYLEADPGDGTAAALATDILYRNNGDGTFTDVTDLLSPAPSGLAYAAVFVDVDDDGDVDLYIANDKGRTGADPVGAPIARNLYWRNDGRGCGGWCFTEVGRTVGLDLRVDGMGIGLIDADGDEDLDLAVTNTGPMRLAIQGAGRGFEDQAAAFGIRTASRTWAPIPFDSDNDGYDDLFVARAIGFGDASASANDLFRGGEYRFTSVERHGAELSGFETICGATADYDQDGAVDLLLGSGRRGFTLHRNGAGEGRQWISFELIGRDGLNRDSIGAKVVVVDSRGRSHVRWVVSNNGLNGGELPVTVGLGSATPVLVEIRWPNGVTTTFDAPLPRTRYAVAYGESRD